MGEGPEWGFLGLGGGVLGVGEGHEGGAVRGGGAYEGVKGWGRGRRGVIWGGEGPE